VAATNLTRLVTDCSSNACCASILACTIEAESFSVNHGAAAVFSLIS
jgi:hypothetical protein